MSKETKNLAVAFKKLDSERARLEFRMNFVAGWVRPWIEHNGDMVLSFDSKSILADAILGRGKFADHEYMDAAIAQKADLIANGKRP